MRKREFVGLICGAVLALPAAVSARQSSKIWRKGHIIVSTSDRAEHLAEALERGLAGAGYAQGQNIVLLTRFATPQPDKVEEVIRSLVPQIDLLVIWSTMGGMAAKRVGSTVPTVFLSVGAPVEDGLVQSLVHPGGNMTGITFEESTETYRKRLQLLKQIVPALRCVAVIGGVGDVNVEFAMSSFNRITPGLGITLVPIAIRSADDLGGAFARIKVSQAEAIIVIAGALTYTVGTQIADLALASHLPSCFAFKEMVVAGGLMSLGPDLAALAEPAAAQIDKIIKGVSPADIPVEQPTHYELYINVKTADLLNLTIPQWILGRADGVIE